MDLTAATAEAAEATLPAGASVSGSAGGGGECARAGGGGWGRVRRAEWSGKRVHQPPPLPLLPGGGVASGAGGGCGQGGRR